MDFGKALEAIKNGKKAKRKGWNGKEQYVVLTYMQECITSHWKQVSDVCWHKRLPVWLACVPG